MEPDQDPQAADDAAPLERAGSARALRGLLEKYAPDPPPSLDELRSGARASAAHHHGRTDSADTATRVLDALRRSAARARRVAAQTGTRLIVVRDGEFVIEHVEPGTAVDPPLEPPA